MKLLGLNKFKSRLLFKYIVSYLAIFSVPFILMSLVIYHNFVIGFQESIEQSNLKNLQQAESVTRDRVKELQSMTTDISYNHGLTPYMVNHRYYGMEAIDILNSYRVNNSLLKEVFVYYHDNKEKLYSSSGLYSIDVFLRQYQFENWTKKKVMEDLGTITPKVFRAEMKGEKENMVVFLNPIGPNNPYPFGTVIYFIKESKFTDVLENVLGNSKGNTYILDTNNRVIGSYKNDSKINLKDVEFSAFKDEGIGRIKNDGNEYFTATVNSEYNGWKLITIMNTNQFFKQVNHKRMIVFLVLIFLFLIGFLIAILLGKSQYTPIGKLFEFTKSHDQDKYSHNKGELESIRDSITNVYESHKSLSRTIYLQKPFAKDQLLIKLLKGNLSTDQDIDYLLRELNIKMQDGAYFVAIVHSNSNEFLVEEGYNLFTEVSILGNDAIVHGVDLLYENATALIISVDKYTNNNVDVRRNIIQKIQDYIKLSTQTIPVIGVGSLVHKKSYINRSFIEALSSMDYKVTTSDENIIYYEDIESLLEQPFGYVQEENGKLVHSLKQGDQKVAEETLRSMFAEIKTKKLSIYELKCVCFDIINIILKTASESNTSEEIKNLNEIVDFNSLDELERNLHSVIRSICGKVESMKNSYQEKLQSNILDFITNHYSEYDLSLEKLAHNFQLSTSYLSRYFKEQFGTNFKRYVLNLRMEKIKKELVETDKLIKEIIRDVGYQDVSNFTRQFRKIEGITPGRYRKLNKKL